MSNIYTRMNLETVTGGRVEGRGLKAEGERRKAKGENRKAEIGNWNQGSGKRRGEIAAGKPVRVAPLCEFKVPFN